MDEIEPHSKTWCFIRAHVTKQIESRQRELETVGLEPARTEGCRAALQELRALLKLAEPSNMAQFDIGTEQGPAL